LIVWLFTFRVSPHDIDNILLIIIV
jgi:hypothetical protein